MIKYFKDKNVLAGVIAAVLLAIVVMAFTLAVYFLITKITIWVVNGIWGFDMSHAFWQVYIGLILISAVCKSNVNISTRSK